MNFTQNHGDQNLYNNADSFAMVFDEQWKKHNSSICKTDKSIEEKLEFIFNEIKEHPFLQSYPQQAREVAKFRVRLLNL